MLDEPGRAVQDERPALEQRLVAGPAFAAAQPLPRHAIDRVAVGADDMKCVGHRSLRPLSGCFGTGAVEGRRRPLRQACAAAVPVGSPRRWRRWNASTIIATPKISA